jgi:hypothetical protein
MIRSSPCIIAHAECGMQFSLQYLLIDHAAAEQVAVGDVITPSVLPGKFSFAVVIGHAPQLQRPVLPPNCLLCR